MILMKYHSLFHSKIGKDVKNLSSAAVVIAVFRVKEERSQGDISFTHPKHVFIDSYQKCSYFEESEFEFSRYYCYSKTLNGHSKIDKTKILITNGCLMKVESIAECSPWSILQYF